LVNTPFARVKVERVVETIVSKDDVRVYMRVQVADAHVVRLDGGLDARPLLGRRRHVASSIILGTALLAVAVDVHVGEEAFLGLKIDYTVVFEVVSAVSSI
jgi:hypothetical protein